MGELGYRVVKLENEVVRVEIFNEDMMEMGCLYFEKGKHGFFRKPTSVDSWLCVDAKVNEMLYSYSGLTPREIIQECRERIGEYRIT